MTTLGLIVVVIPTPVASPALLKSLVVSVVLLVALAVVACLLQMERDFARVRDGVAYAGAHRSAVGWLPAPPLVDRIPMYPPMHYTPPTLVRTHRAMGAALATHAIGQEVHRVAA